MKCSKVFCRSRVGARTFGALSWPTLIRGEECQVARFARNDFGPVAWQSGGIDGGVGPGRGLLRLICRGDRR